MKNLVPNEQCNEWQREVNSDRYIQKKPQIVKSVLLGTTENPQKLENLAISSQTCNC